MMFHVSQVVGLGISEPSTVVPFPGDVSSLNRQKMVAT